MVDKQVIINGCDVAGCEYLGLYKECKLKCGSCCPIDCSDNPNCYYKQLKRKEQECQQAMDNYVQLDLQRVKEYNELVDLYKAKEQECERLRFPMKDSNYAILTKEEFEDYKKLKQTLTEIKEIAEKHKITAHCDYLTDMDNIIQKISECGVENG